MVREKITIQKTVDFLNEILKIDSVAITALFSSRIACNENLAKHETVQVGRLGKDYCQVGMIGIFNGLFGIDEHGWGHISADYDNGMIIKFRVLTSSDVDSIIKGVT